MVALTFAIAMPIGSWNPVLPDVVASLLSQSVSMKVAVLDASGDARVRGALSSLQPHIAYRREGPDTGQASAIKEGWNNLEGDVYGWLNFDDILYPNALSLVEDAFLSDPAAGIVTGHSTYLSPQFDVYGVHPAVSPPSRQILRNNMISQPSTFVREAALAEVGSINPSLHYTMDWDLWMKLWQSGAGFISLDEVISGVVIEPNTKTSQFNLKRAGELFSIVARNAGPLNALKSVLGFWQYHRSNQSLIRQETDTARRSVSRQAHSPFLVMSEPVNRRVRLPLVCYSRQITALRVHGMGNFRVVLPKSQNRVAAPGERIGFTLDKGTQATIEIAPAERQSVRVHRVELLSDVNAQAV